MDRLKEIKKEVNALNKTRDDYIKTIDKQINNLWKEYRKEQNKREEELLKDKFHVGEYYYTEEKYQSYHSLVFTIYEIIKVSGYSTTCRLYKLNRADSDYYTVISKDIFCGVHDHETLFESKKLDRETFESIYKPIVMNPDTYEESELFNK